MSDLDTLESQAAALDADIAAGNAIPDPAVEQAAQIAAGNAPFQPLLKQVIGIVVVGASAKWPAIREHYTPAAVDEIAASIVALCDEYAIDLQQWLGQGGGKLQAWLRLAMAAGLPLLGVLSALKAPSPAPVRDVPADTPSMEG